MSILQPLYESQFFDRFSTRRSRRLLVLAYLAAASAYPLLGWLTGNLWLVFAALLPYFALMTVLQGSSRGLHDLRDAKLDERQRSLRDSIYPLAFQIGIVVTIYFGIMIGAFMASEPDQASPNFDRFEALQLSVIFTFFVIVPLIPNLLLAWKLPDEVRDES